MSSDIMNFAGLVDVIRQTDAAFATQAAKAVNISLTLRNWYIGHYITEYEQKGADRAKYGERLLDLLAERLAPAGLKRMDARELRRFRLFYSTYPQIREALTPILDSLPAAGQLGLPAIRETASPESIQTQLPALAIPVRRLLERLSFSHFVSRYQVQLPAQEEMESFLRQALADLGAVDPAEAGRVGV
jgi:hypothetical protein